MLNQFFDSTWLDEQIHDNNFDFADFAEFVETSFKEDLDQVIRNHVSSYENSIIEDLVNIGLSEIDFWQWAKDYWSDYVYRDPYGDFAEDDNDDEENEGYIVF